jgi:Tol biopolymer transport system component
VRVTVQNRVPEDRISHTMIWTQSVVPNPVRVEGPNHILADGPPEGVFPVDISLWSDGRYTILARAYYYAGPGAPLQRLDTRVTLTVEGGPVPPRLRLTARDLEVEAGRPLVLTLSLDPPDAAVELVEAVLVSRGQELGPEHRIPLDQSELTVAAWDGLGELRVDTSGWYPQVLTCLAARAQLRAGSGTVTLTAAVPALSLVSPEGGSDPRVLRSYRGDREIRLITADPCMNTFPYPTCSAWRADGRDVFFESDRAGPDGDRTAGERQLMMADIETGSVTHLATLGLEPVEPYGPFHVSASSQYHTDYAAGADLLVYYDMTGHRMYTLRPGGVPVEVLHETSGRIGDPPAIARDGSRILYYTILPGPTESRYFTGLTSAIFTLDIDPGTGAALGPPTLVYAYPWRKSPPREGRVDFSGLIGCDHVQFCPRDPTQIMFAHEGGFPRNGEPENTRIWCMNDDGSNLRSMAPEQEAGNFYTHEVYGPSGRFIYTVWSGSVARIEVETGGFECVYRAGAPLRACHIAVSPDEAWIAADMLGGFGQDSSGNGIGGLFLIETATGEATFLAAFPAGGGHPRHVHPNFSPDGTRVGFTLAQGRSHSQIAWIDIRDLVASTEPHSSEGD